MDANQESLSNPYGMDKACENCPELCETRTNVVHGYGDVGAEFLVLGHAPSEESDASGLPFVGDHERELLDILSAVDLVDDPDAERPQFDNVYLTYTARCHHPERGPSEEEVRSCEPYLNSEVRMINPELLLPVGQAALDALAFEYTTLSEDELDIEERHATTIRGRGFELLPMIEPWKQTDDQRDAFLQHLSETLGRDYRQTKGRRSR